MGADNSKNNSKAKEERIARLTPFRFKPGQSGNPGGRPKTPPVTERYRQVLEHPVPDWLLDKINKNGTVLARGATFGDALAVSTVIGGITGDTTAAKEIREAVEGRSRQRIEFGMPGMGGPVDKPSDEALPGATQEITFRVIYGDKDK